jgi:predicted AlkP superfamily pyrophosphatase or phosphodiesterase
MAPAKAKVANFGTAAFVICSRRAPSTPRAPTSTSSISTGMVAASPPDDLDALGQRSYVTTTFQKTGAVNLRMPWTFFRKAVGLSHSPHGT